MFLCHWHLTQAWAKHLPGRTDNDDKDAFWRQLMGLLRWRAWRCIPAEELITRLVANLLALYNVPESFRTYFTKEWMGVFPPGEYHPRWCTHA